MVIVNMFSPLAQVAEVPLGTATPSVSSLFVRTTTITADGSSVVAVTLLVALEVVTAYANVSLSNSGTNVKSPIVSADSELSTTLFLLLLLRNSYLLLYHLQP